MLFRPSFCANCGEKIERANWGLLTSRRFCQVCESEFKGLDLIPRAIVAGGLVLAISGLGGYLRSGNSAQTALVSTAQRPIAQRPDSRPVLEPKPIETPAIETVTAPRSPKVAPVSPAASAPEIAEAVYFCGARTKKGSPCSRRVKGNVRCFQHLGSDAMMPPDKLKIR